MAAWCGPITTVLAREVGAPKQQYDLKAHHASVGGW
jgi:hypothetical protein